MNGTRQMIIAALVALTAIGLLPQLRLSRYWHLDSSSKINTSEPHDGQDGCLPDQYMVHLREDYPYESHKAAVASAVDLDAAIYVSFTLEPGRFIYAAYLNETALAAVKADDGMLLVECDGTVEPD